LSTEQIETSAETVKEMVVILSFSLTEAIPIFRSLTMPPNQPTVKGILQSSQIPYRASIAS
jgi:hypothetical protein